MNVTQIYEEPQIKTVTPRRVVSVSHNDASLADEYINIGSFG